MSDTCEHGVNFYEKRCFVCRPLDTPKPKGGARDGSGRKPMKEPPKNRAIRCTEAGWKWLNDQATTKGHSSVGKWADAKGKKKA